MKTKTKGNRWRKVKWINTPFAKKYRTRIAARNMIMAAQLGRTICELSAIRSGFSTHPAVKKTAMVQAAVNTFASLARIDKQPDFYKGCGMPMEKKPCNAKATLGDQSP